MQTNEAYTSKSIPLITIISVLTAATVTLAYVFRLKPTGLAAFIFFSIWLLLPYINMAVALFIFKRKQLKTIYWYAVIVFVCISGVVSLSNSINWHPDAQGAIAVLLTPILQAGIFLIAWIVKWVVADLGKDDKQS